jgi:hypothetical protein
VEPTFDALIALRAEPELKGRSATRRPRSFPTGSPAADGGMTPTITALNYDEDERTAPSGASPSAVAGSAGSWLARPVSPGRPFLLRATTLPADPERPFSATPPPEANLKQEVCARIAEGETKADWREGAHAGDVNDLSGARE